MNNLTVEQVEKGLITINELTFDMQKDENGWRFKNSKLYVSQFVDWFEFWRSVSDIQKFARDNNVSSVSLFLLIAWFIEEIVND